MGFKSDSLILPVLLACRESFGVASKVYTKSFSSFGGLAQTYFNFHLDTLYLDWESSPDLADIDFERDILPYFCDDELAKVERLAIHRAILEKVSHPTEYVLCLVLSLFSGSVKRLTIVVEHHKKEPIAQEVVEDSSQPLTFVDPVDIRRRWYMFQHPEYHLNHDRGPTGTRIPNIHFWIKPADPDLDDAREYYRDEWDCDILPFSMPETIDYKILSSSRIKTKLEQLQQEYEKVASCRCYNGESVVKKVPDYVWGYGSDSDSDSDEETDSDSELETDSDQDDQN